jgi:WD40 repeat protein
MVLSIVILIGVTIQNAQADLMIAVDDPPSLPSVLRYNQVTGDLIGEFITFSDGEIHPTNLTYGPDGNLYVASFFSQNIVRYNGITGAFIDVFVPPGSGGLAAPNGMTFGPDGNLYVPSYFYTNTPGILRYNGKTGAFIDVFVPGGKFLFKPEFGPDGNLYIPSPTGILRYDGKTGLPYPALGESGAFFAYGDELPIAVGSNGDLFVSSQCRNVLRYNGTTGALISTFIVGVPIPVDTQCINGMAFGPDGNLYITGFYSTVYRYDGTTGAFINSFGTGQRGTSGLTFTPFPTSKDQCKNGGWKAFGFKNQGQCIQYVNTRNDHGDK